jgi:hypothetical protein
MVKRLGREAGHSPPIIADVDITFTYTPPPLKPISLHAVVLNTSSRGTAKLYAVFKSSLRLRYQNRGTKVGRLCLERYVTFCFQQAMGTEIAITGTPLKTPTFHSSCLPVQGVMCTQGCLKVQLSP